MTMADLHDEQRMLQETLRRFLSDNYGKDERGGTGRDIIPELAELGVIGALFSEADGGFGGGGSDLAIVFEELGRAGVVEPLIDSALICGRLIADLGTEEQRGLLQDIIGGKLKLAFAHSETAARYDLGHVETRLEDGVLNGHKAVVVNAQDATRLLISARLHGSSDDPSGIGLFLVPVDADGVTVQGYMLAQGGTGAEVTLENVTSWTLISDEALPSIEKTIAAATLCQCAETLGSMETAVEMTRTYLMTRQQFGKPLAAFQALAHRFADLVIECEQARSAVAFAAQHLDAEPRHRDRHISAAKNLIGRAGRLIAEETMQMHGGMGMTAEYDLGHFTKRIIMADHRFGDTDHHLERFIQLGLQHGPT